MLMEQTNYQQWLEARDAHRQQLFGEFVLCVAVDDEPSHTATATNLAKIALATDLVGGMTNYERYTRGELNEGITNILTYHDMQAGEVDGEALFGLVDSDKDFEQVASLTSRVIWVWDRACTRHAKKVGPSTGSSPSPFAELPIDNIQATDFARTDVQLVVETAAAVSEVLQMGYPSGSTNGNLHNLLAGFIAQRGPAYAAAWLRGDILKEYCNARDLDTERFLGLIDGGMRKQIALWHPKNPPAYAEHTIKIVDDLLMPEKLAMSSGLSIVEVSDILTARLRVRIARQYSSDPEKAALTLLKNIREVDMDHIASRFNLPLSICEHLFTSAVIRSAFRDNVFNPWPVLQRIARAAKQLETAVLSEELGISSQTIDTYLPIWQRVKLAQRSSAQTASRAKEMIGIAQDIADTYGLSPQLSSFIAYKYPPKLAQQVARQSTTNCPPGTDKLMWAWATARLPNADTSVRMGHITQYINWLRIHFPDYSLDTSREGRQPLAERIGDNSFDPQVIVGDDIPSDFLLLLADQAGLSQHELGELLDHFAKGDIDTLLVKLKKTLTQLRSVA